MIAVEQTRSPLNGRKVGPKKTSKTIPEVAWDDERVQNYRLFSIIDVERLQESTSDAELLESSAKEDLRLTCKVINLPEDINRNNCSQYEQLLTPFAVKLAEKNAKWRTKSKKYFCPPYFIMLASVLEISVYLWGGDDVERLFMYSPRQRHEAWRFISYMLLHHGVIHLTLNIIIQMLLATPLEFEQGWMRSAIVYLSGGLIGALGASVFQPTLYMVGASAGVYALLISHVANVIVRYSSIKYLKQRLFAVVVLALSDIGFSLAHCYSETLSSPRIGWAAHCAGAFAGITLGLIVYSGEDRKNKYIKICIWIAGVILLLAIIASVIFNVFIKIL